MTTLEVAYLIFSMLAMWFFLGMVSMAFGIVVNFIFNMHIFAPKSDKVTKWVE